MPNADDDRFLSAKICLSHIVIWITTMASIGDQEPRCVNCGEVGHWAVACYNERVERPM